MTVTRATQPHTQPKRPPPRGCGGTKTSFRQLLIFTCSTSENACQRKSVRVSRSRAPPGGSPREAGGRGPRRRMSELGQSARREPRPPDQKCLSEPRTPVRGLRAPPLAWRVLLGAVSRRAAGTRLGPDFGSSAGASVPARTLRLVRTRRGHAALRFVYGSMRRSPARPTWRQPRAGAGATSRANKGAGAAIVTPRRPVGP